MRVSGQILRTRARHRHGHRRRRGRVPPRQRDVMLTHDVTLLQSPVPSSATLFCDVPGRRSAERPAAGRSAPAALGRWSPRTISPSTASLSSADLVELLEELAQFLEVIHVVIGLFAQSITLHYTMICHILLARASCSVESRIYVKLASLLLLRCRAANTNNRLIIVVLVSLKKSKASLPSLTPSPSRPPC